MKSHAYLKEISFLLCHCELPGKGKRLKQAKEEAMAEVDQYRMQRDQEFRLKQSKVSQDACTDLCCIEDKILIFIRHKE